MYVGFDSPATTPQLGFAKDMFDSVFSSNSEKLRQTVVGIYNLNLYFWVRGKQACMH